MDGRPFSTSDPFPDADANLLYGTQHVKDLCLRARSEDEGRCAAVFWCMAVPPSLSPPAPHIARPTRHPEGVQGWVGDVAACTQRRHRAALRIP